MADVIAIGARRDVVAAVSLFLLVNGLALAMNGVRHGGDTPLYTDGAQRIRDGRPLEGRQPSYRGYIWAVAGAEAAGTGPAGVIAAQLVAGAAAAAAIYAMAAALAGRVAGGLAAVLVAVDFDTNRWHQFILADSLYISLFTIAVWSTHRAAIRRGAPSVAAAMTVLVAAALVRPEGWFTIPAAIAYVVWMRARTVGRRMAGIGALLLASVLVVVTVAPSMSGNLQAVGPAAMLQRGQTIWDYDGWRIVMPPAEPTTAGQAGSAIRYAVDHPFSTIRLMAARVAVHFAHVRPFYSLPHNAVIVVWLVPVYAAALFATWRLRRVPLVLWLVLAIATQTLVVALTHAESDGRYLAHVLPLIHALAAAAVALTIAPERTQQPVDV
ncbi:MAG TPA: glycosyltransferase family 39 protein [Vicinamibacterales bacterium]|nr:glycosyltransferase family 39 protein [Vicinamibacterales bacterium]